MKDKRRPNIIFFLADDLGYGDLGCYGVTDIKSPNIDRMASEGVLFTDAYAAAPVCSPTRVAFVTGRYQQRIGDYAEDYMGAQNPGLKAEEHPTIAMYLKEAGYKTACFGKWNIGGVGNINPIQHGFDTWIGFHHNINYFSHSQKWYKNAMLYDGPPALYEDDKTVLLDGYLDDIFAQKSIDYIYENAHGEQPFFIYIPWQTPHEPMQSPSGDCCEVPEYGNTSFEKDRPTYIEMVERMDKLIGLVIDTLKETGIDHNTLVVFGSDNGGHRVSRNLPLKGYKQDLDEGGIRIPFIMQWPGVIPGGKVCSQMSITMDITTTIAALANARIPQEHSMDGIDLMPYASGERQSDVNRTLYWRRRTIDIPKKVNNVRAKAIREGEWKYILDFARKTEALYNLKKDLAEAKNLIDERPDITEKLRNKLKSWEDNIGNTKTDDHIIPGEI